MDSESRNCVQVTLGDDQAGVAGEIRGQGLATAWRLARSRPVANAAAGAADDQVPDPGC